MLSGPDDFHGLQSDNNLYTLAAEISMSVICGKEDRLLFGKKSVFSILNNDLNYLFRFSDFSNKSEMTQPFRDVQNMLE